MKLPAIAALFSIGLIAQPIVIQPPCVAWATTITNGRTVMLCVAPATLPGVQQALGYMPENPANKGAPNGYAPLDSSGKVPPANLPPAGAGQFVPPASATQATCTNMNPAGGPMMWVIAWGNGTCSEVQILTPGQAAAVASVDLPNGQHLRAAGPIVNVGGLILARSAEVSPKGVALLILGYDSHGRKVFVAGEPRP